MSNEPKQSMNPDQREDPRESTCPSGNRVLPHEEEHLDFGAAMVALRQDS